MRRTYTALVVLCAMVSAAQAGGPVHLSDRQMDTVSAGSATASVSMAGAVDGPHATLQSAIYNVAAVFPDSSLAQSGAAILATGTTAATDMLSQSTAEGERATATAGGSASGQQALVASLTVTTAGTTTNPTGLKVGIADAATYTLSLSFTGRY